MKKIIILLGLSTALFSATSFAALNSYLQIKGSKGASQVISCPNGACVVPALAADTYTVSLVDAQGKAASVEGKYECSIVSPRDSASGLATGKRMHKPLVITKEINSSALDIAQDEKDLAITCVSNPTAPTVEEFKAKTATYDLKAAKK
jgi:hypothetical protein